MPSHTESERKKASRQKRKESGGKKVTKVKKKSSGKNPFRSNPKKR